MDTFAWTGEHMRIVAGGPGRGTGARDDPVTLDRHDEVTGDGVLATFDAPTRALRCAFALIDALGDVGIEIRSAIHTGEIEIRDNDVGGIGVHIGARAWLRPPIGRSS